MVVWTSLLTIWLQIPVMAEQIGPPPAALHPGNPETTEQNESSHQISHPTKPGKSENENPTESPVLGGEYRVKAAFVYNFIKLTRWPEHALPPSEPVFRICITPKNPFCAPFFQLNTKQVKGKRILVRQWDDPIEDAPCHVLFISSNNPDFIRERLRLISGKSILTIGETEGFIQLGGILNFVQDEKRLRFQANPDAARRVGLTLSSKILMSAEVVRMGEK